MSQQLPLSELVSRDFTGNPSAQASSPAKRSAQQAPLKLPRNGEGDAQSDAQGHEEGGEGHAYGSAPAPFGLGKLNETLKLNTNLTIQLRPKTLIES